MPLIYLIVRIKRGVRLSYIDAEEHILSMPVIWGFKLEGKNITTKNNLIQQLNTKIGDTLS